MAQGTVCVNPTTPRSHAEASVVGVVISDDWDDTFWLSTVSERMAEDNVRLVMPHRSARELYLGFVAMLDGVLVGEARDIAATVAEADTLLLYGPKISRRLRKARALGLAKGIEVHWYTRRPKTHYKLVRTPRLRRRRKERA